MKDMFDEALDEVVEATVDTVETTAPAEAETKKRDPLAKYNELNADDKAKVDGIVADVIARVGGEDINLSLLLGVLDRLNAEKKTAREAEKTKEKERKEAEKQEAASRGEALKEKVKVGDKIDYYMSTTKVTILQAEVLKVTEKSARIDVTADSLVLYKGNTVKAGTVAGLKLGKKSVPFAKIRNWSGEASDTAETPAETKAEGVA